MLSNEALTTLRLVQDLIDGVLCSLREDKDLLVLPRPYDDSLSFPFCCELYVLQKRPLHRLSALHIFQ